MFLSEAIRTKLALIPSEQIEKYHLRIRLFDEKHKNYFLEGYRIMVNDVGEGKPTVIIHPDDLNLDDVLEVIHGRNAVRDFYAILPLSENTISMYSETFARIL